jgi:hypothetical protein
MPELAATRNPAAVRESSIVRLTNTYFYFGMSLLILVVVVIGFSRTVDRNLIHPAIPRPFLLYVHAAIFSGLLFFFILQSALVRTRNVRIHRTLGWFGMGMGGFMPFLGVVTAIVMGRFDTLQLHQTDAELTLIIPLFDMAVFGSAFALAMLWRKRPEYHRRLVLIASCALTAAAFGRLPERILPSAFFYAGVDSLILLGVLRDLIVNRSLHSVYRYALPLIITGQLAVMYILFHSPRLWLAIAHAVLRT